MSEPDVRDENTANLFDPASLARERQTWQDARKPCDHPDVLRESIENETALVTLLEAKSNEVERLQAWKAEAMAVLSRWDDVADLFPLPPDALKSEAVLERVKALQECAVEMVILRAERGALSAQRDELQAKYDLVLDRIGAAIQLLETNVDPEDVIEALWPAALRVPVDGDDR